MMQWIADKRGSAFMAMLVSVLISFLFAIFLDAQFFVQGCAEPLSPPQQGGNASQDTYDTGYSHGFADGLEGYRNPEVAYNPVASSEYYYYDLGYNDGYADATQGGDGGGGGGSAPPPGGGGGGSYCVRLQAIASRGTTQLRCLVNGSVVAKGAGPGITYSTISDGPQYPSGTKLTIEANGGLGLGGGSQIYVIDMDTGEQASLYACTTPIDETNSCGDGNSVTRTIP